MSPEPPPEKYTLKDAINLAHGLRDMEPQGDPPTLEEALDLVNEALRESKFNWLTGQKARELILWGLGKPDPTGIHFKDYYDQHIWSPPEGKERRQHCINPVLLRERFSYFVTCCTNEYFAKESPYNKWEKILEAGRDYLVGKDVPMKKFIRKHTTYLNGWQRLAFKWCQANPTKGLELRSERCGVDLRGFAYRHYVIQKRGEFVEFGLPFHDAGGEKHWVSCDGKTKVLINVD